MLILLKIFQFLLTSIITTLLICSAIVVSAVVVVVENEEFQNEENDGFNQHVSSSSPTEDDVDLSSKILTSTNNNNNDDGDSSSLINVWLLFNNLYNYYLLDNNNNIQKNIEEIGDNRKLLNSYYSLLNQLFSTSCSFKLIKLILLRIETIAIICLIGIFSLIFLTHRRNTNNNNNVINQTNQRPTIIHQQSSIYCILTKLIRCLNFTILFSNLIHLVDSTIKSYIEPHLYHHHSHNSIINQHNFGLAGAYSMQGRRTNMEDCFSLKNNIANDLGIDYYAVFDGHGGANAALYADKEIFENISKRIKDFLLSEKDKSKSLQKKIQSSDTETCSKSSSYWSTNKLDDHCCQAKSNSGVGKYKLEKFESLTLNIMKQIVNEEIVNVDKRLVETFQKKSDISGTTALIAIRLLYSNKLLVANVGDSRGILCDSKGATIPLSFDHKPYQSKEYRRIVEAGGYISHKGVYRVNGILAISRALGDYPLKDNRLIIPDPDILLFDLNELMPKFMVMATDGFWDTFSNEQACQFVHNELNKFNKMDLLNQPSMVALKIAKHLANEAYNRESYDNITVIFVLFNNNNNNKNETIAKVTSSNTKQQSSPSSSSSSSSSSNNSSPPANNNNKES